MVEGNDPAKLGRAVKNMVELNGSAAAHLQDGVAMVEFLHLFDEQPAGSPDRDSRRAGTRGVARACRRAHAEPAQGHFLRDDFRCRRTCRHHALPGDDGERSHDPFRRDVPDRFGRAICQRHDLTSPARSLSAPCLTNSDVFFTLALKGMIAISTARFPEGTRGCEPRSAGAHRAVEGRCRFRPWHGHGVGSYLSEHEGPQRISRVSTQELLPGMILSNEPGYYRPGSFGIRIENLIYVREAEAIDVGTSRCSGSRR